jgi:hypothetical protein
MQQNCALMVTKGEVKEVTSCKLVAAANSINIPLF